MLFSNVANRQTPITQNLAIKHHTNQETRLNNHDGKHKVQQNPLTCVGVVLLTDKSTDKQTNDGENIPSYGEGNRN